MIIKGLQKLTLLDFPGHIAATVFTYGCNFKCLFCHNYMLVNGDLADADWIKTDDFINWLKTRKGVLEGVCITGGEPTLNPYELYNLIDEIKKLGFLVKLDTNGSNTDIVQYICDNRLVDYIAMDIKNSKNKYCNTSGISNEIWSVDKISESINIIMNSDIDYEFRTTVVKELHTKDDLISIAKWIKGCKKYYLQVFEDRYGILSKNKYSAYSKQEMNDILKEVKKIVPQAVLRGK